MSHGTRPLAAIALLVLAGLTACVPPKIDGVARCARSATTGRVFELPGSDCDPGAIHVDEPCGPLLTTAAEDDVCVSYWVAATGDYRIGPLSALVPADRVIAVFR